MKDKLTIEESAKLIELGVDAKLASKESAVWGKFKSHKRPIFTLTDILSILPKEIDGNILVINATGFNIESEEYEEGWCVFYVNSNFDVAYGEKSIFSAPELIDALNQLLKWVLSNGHYKKKQQ